MKLYVVTANTYQEGYGTEIELIGVADSETHSNYLVDYAKRNKWNPTIAIVEINNIEVKYLGGYVE